MELIDAKLITPENRGLPEIDGAPIKTTHPCQKCGKPVNLLEGPSASIRFHTTFDGGKTKSSEGFEAVHVNGCPES